MAFGVFHVALGIELDLSQPDLGHPTRPTLWDELHHHCKRGMLQCLQCRAERPECPEWMYLRERHGQREAAHFNTAIAGHGESDAHKALKERIATAAAAGGFESVLEQRAPHGRRRTDVLVRGNGVLLGCEPQLSPITAQTVRKRTAVAQADGITPMWMTDDRKAQLIDQAPWVRIDRMPWHLYLGDNQIPIRGGVRGLLIERCGRRSGICPDRKLGQKCSGWHGYWEPRQLERFDDLIVRAAGADLVPIKQPVGETGRRAHWFWATAEDLAKVEPVAADDTDSGGEDPLVKTVDAVGRVVDRYCRYQQRPRRDGHRREEKQERPPAAIPVRLRPETTEPTTHPTGSGRAPQARRQSSTSRITLDWSGPEHWSQSQQPCRICDQPTQLRDPQGQPCHKVCAEVMINNLGGAS